MKKIFSRRLLPMMMLMLWLASACTHSDSSLEQMIPADATAILRLDVPTMVKAAGLTDEAEIQRAMQQLSDNAADDDSPLVQLLTDLPVLGLDFHSSAYVFTTDKTFSIVTLAALADEQAARQTLEKRIGARFDTSDGLNCLYREDTFCAIADGTLLVAETAKPVERAKAAAAAKAIMAKQMSNIQTDKDVIKVLHRNEYAINAYLRPQSLKGLSTSTSTSSDMLADIGINGLTFGVKMSERQVTLNADILADANGDYVRLANTLLAEPDTAFLAVVPNSMEMICAVSVNGQNVCNLPIVQQFIQQYGDLAKVAGIDITALLSAINGPVAVGMARDPHLPVVAHGDRLYGIGSNDCGGGLVTLLQVFRFLTSSPSSGRDYNLVYLASAEEEVSGKDGLERVLPLLPRIDVAIVGEPTAMQPAVAERGLMVIDGYAHGKSGHAARNEGINAIYEALDDLVWLRDYNFRKVSPLLGPTKMTVTVVESGTQHNVVPDVLHFVVDVRTNEYYQNEYVFEFLRKHMEKCELKARSFRLHSSSIAPDHPLVQRCRQMGMTPFGSPTLSDQALMPFPSLKLGPGESSRSHSADEFIRISEIRQAISTYVHLLTGLSL